MEPTKFYFDVRDIFRSPRISLSGRKIWLFFKANLFGFVVYWMLTYLALILNGNSFLNSIEKYGLYPCLYSIDERTLFPLIVYWTGIIIWLYAIIYACTAVSRITVQQLKGNELFSVADARKFVKEYKLKVIMSSISVLAIALFFFFGFVTFALLGKIPIFGEILFALLYILYFFAAIFTLYTLVVFLISLFYSPSIVATMEEDTISTVHQNYSIVWSQPWRLIAYNSVLFTLVIVSVYFMKMVTLLSYKSIFHLFSLKWLMGDKAENIIGWATELVIAFPDTFLISIQDGIGIPLPEYIAATILALIFLSILLIIVSYGLSLLSVGETIIFIILKMKSTGENLLERVEKDELLLNKDNFNNELAS